MRVLAGEGPILTAFAYGNSFARDVRAGMKRFLTRYRNAGISFDNAVATGRHFADGPFPGAAFTRGKVYSAEALPYKTMMEFVRSIRLDGRRRFVAANTPGHYAVAALTDVGLLENRDPRWRRNMRHLLGTKPFIWSGHSATDREKAELLALEAMLEGIYLYHGPYDAPDGKWKDYRIEVLELSHIGWNPLRGASVNAPLALERFGSGGGSRYVVGHFTNTARTARISVDLKRGDSEVVLFAVEGQRLQWRRKGSRLTASVKIPARGYRILKGLVSIKIKPSQIKSYDITWQKDLLSAKLSLTEETRGSLRLFLPPGKTLKELRINRRRVGDVSAGDVELTRTCTVSVTMENDVFVSPGKERVKSFGFLKARKPNSEIVPLAGEEAGELAGRLQDYFAFYDVWNRSLRRQNGQSPVLPERILRIPIARGKAAAANRAAVGVIGSRSAWAKKLSREARKALSEGRPVIEVTPHRKRRLLIVGGKDEATARKALFSLLCILDEKYVLKGKGKR
jgi:hypothetical protein